MDENSRLSADMARLNEELDQSKKEETTLTLEIGQLKESFLNQVSYLSLAESSSTRLLYPRQYDAVFLQMQDGQKSTDLLQERIDSLQNDLATTGELLNEKLSALDQLENDYRVTNEQCLEYREKLDASQTDLADAQRANTDLEAQV